MWGTPLSYIRELDGAGLVCQFPLAHTTRKDAEHAISRSRPKLAIDSSQVAGDRLEKVRELLRKGRLSAPEELFQVYEFLAGTSCPELNSKPSQ